MLHVIVHIMSIIAHFKDVSLLFMDFDFVWFSLYSTAQVSLIIEFKEICTLIAIPEKLCSGTSGSSFRGQKQLFTTIPIAQQPMISLYSMTDDCSRETSLRS